jgi:hypothetical protein
MQNEEEKNKERSSRIPTPEEVERYNRRLNDEEIVSSQKGSPRLYYPDKVVAKTEYKPDRRDYFAAAALTGLLANPEYLKWIKESNLPDMNAMYSMEAIDHADDIIKRLNETK